MSTTSGVAAAAAPSAAAASAAAAGSDSKSRAGLPRSTSNPEEDGSLTSGAHSTIWLRTEQEAREVYTPLRSDVSNADVVVVGAGITGLCTAYMASRAGHRVVVLDDGDVASGETGRTSAHLTYGLDVGYHELKGMHGRESARLAAESHQQAINDIEEIVRREAIECDFKRVPGYLISHKVDSKGHVDDKPVLDEAKAVRECDIKAPDLVDRVPDMDFNTGRALRFPDQAQFHATKFITGLAKVLSRRVAPSTSTSTGSAGRASLELKEGECRIFCNSKVTTYTGGKKCTATTAEGFVVHADHVVLATNVPLNMLTVSADSVDPHRTYMIVARIPRNGNYSLVWDTEEPLHYVRKQPDPNDAKSDFLLIGGEDHVVGREKDFEARYAHLEQWARKRWPAMGEVVMKWSGQIEDSNDYLAFIGHNPHDKQNVWISSADSGNGLTYGMIAGRLLTDLIMGNKNPYAKLYDPSRRTVKALGQYAKAMLTAQVQYRRWLQKGDVQDIEELKPCQGAVVRNSLTSLPIAAYRDEHGVLHRKSAVCPHMGAIVTWNSDEKSWDCPAHGSRFTALGDVINGPAKSCLGECGKMHEKEGAGEAAPSSSSSTTTAAAAAAASAQPMPGRRIELDRDDDSKVGGPSSGFKPGVPTGTSQTSSTATK